MEAVVVVLAGEDGKLHWVIAVAVSRSCIPHVF